MLIASRKPASQSFGFVFADSQFLLACLAATRSSGSHGAVSMETIAHIPYEQTAAVEAWADVRFKGQ